MDYLYSPFPLLAVIGKLRTSRTVCDALTDCPRLHTNDKNVKSTVVRSGRWAGRTVCQEPADRPPGPRRPSAWAAQTVRGQAADRSLDPPSCTPFCLVLRRITDHPHRAHGQSAWKRIFLEDICQKPQILNKYQTPTDRPPREPGLSAQHLKTNVS
jgi:hypothetical protein